MRYVAALVLVMACSGDHGIGASERGRLLAMRQVWIAEARAERCPRPALREPVAGNASARLEALNDKSSPARRCLALLDDPQKSLRTELGPCLPKEHCGPLTLATVKPHPDLVEACQPLYADIAATAHANEACANVFAWDLASIGPLVQISNAVRLEVASLAADGKLGEASARVLDAMRFADDLARKGALIGAAMSIVAMQRLVNTLDEIAIDPRLTIEEARSIARDLDVLLETSPRWDAIMRQERAFAATELARHDDTVPELARLETEDLAIRRVCSGTLRACVEHYDEVPNGAILKPYVQGLGARDSALAFVRMQIELRLARAEVCADAARREAILQPWADRAVVGDEPEPVVTLPLWQRDPATLNSTPRTLRCVPATI